MSPRRRDRRHLVKRGSVWYFERVIDGRRIRESLRTGNLEEARVRRDALERELATAPFSTRETPTFATAAHDALAAMETRRSAGAESGYAATTASDEDFRRAKKLPTEPRTRCRPKRAIPMGRAARFGSMTEWSFMSVLLFQSSRVHGFENRRASITEKCEDDRIAGGNERDANV